MEPRLDEDLPEHLAMLFDPSNGKFSMPLDANGYPDLDSFAEIAIRTLPVEFDNSTKNTHHIYPWSHYRRNFGRPLDADSFIAHTYTDIGPNKLRMPKQLHLWGESIVDPPPYPSVERMAGKISSWVLAVSAWAQHRYQGRDEKLIELYHAPRLTYTYFPGLTSRSQRKGDVPNELIEVIEEQFWKSEYEIRATRRDGLLEQLESAHDEIPLEDRVLPDLELATLNGLAKHFTERRWSTAVLSQPDAA